MNWPETREHRWMCRWRNFSVLAWGCAHDKMSTVYKVLHIISRRQRQNCKRHVHPCPHTASVKVKKKRASTCIGGNSSQVSPVQTPFQVVPHPPFYIHTTVAHSKVGELNLSSRAERSLGLVENHRVSSNESNFWQSWKLKDNLKYATILVFGSLLKQLCNFTHGGMLRACSQYLPLQRNLAGWRTLRC